TNVCDLASEPFHVHHAVVRDGNQLRAFAEIMFGRVMDARMLDGANPDFRFVPERFGEVMDAHVVGFSRATGPDDITGMAAKVMRELFASFGHGFVGGMTKLMRAGGIAVNFFRSLQPCLA